MIEKLRWMLRPIVERPLATDGFTSYRYKGRYGWIMIGARSVEDALKEASHSTSEEVIIDNLQVWNGEEYMPVSP